MLPPSAAGIRDVMNLFPCMTDEVEDHGQNAFPPVLAGFGDMNQSAPPLCPGWIQSFLGRIHSK